jgi:hypothetical protein
VGADVPRPGRNLEELPEFLMAPHESLLFILIKFHSCIIRNIKQGYMHHHSDQFIRKATYSCMVTWQSVHQEKIDEFSPA